MSDTTEKNENMSFAEATAKPCPPPKGMSPRPGQIVCGDIDMRIATDGTWYYQGSPIARQKLVNLFSTVVRRDEDGQYWLITPAEMARITVEDAPFLAVELASTNDNGVRMLKLRTNVDKWFIIDADHPIRVDVDAVSGEPRPYIKLAADGTEARITRNVFYELVEMSEQTDINGRQMLTIGSVGETFILGPAAEDT